MSTAQTTQRHGAEITVQGPGKAMRIEAMTGELLAELRTTPLDEGSRTRLAAIHDRTVRELADALPDGMRLELGRLVTEFGTDAAPSEGELRVAEAQLLGWLGGVVAAAEASIIHHATLGQAGGLPPVADAVVATGPGYEAPEEYL